MSVTRIVVTRNDFRRIASELTPKIQKIVITTAYEVEAEIKETVPWKTHNLQRSYHIAPIDETHCEVGTDVEYAPFVEYGTVHMSARPHVHPSVEHSRPRFYDRLRKLFT